MHQENKHLEDIKEIRSIMERSTQFLSLSGLSGVFAGIFALLGAAVVYFQKMRYFNEDHFSGRTSMIRELFSGGDYADFVVFVFATGLVVLVLALLSVVIFSLRNARRKGLPIWNPTARRVLTNLFIPLATGGLFCLILLYHNLGYMVAPVTLIFYGLALINASKYTIRDIRYLGFSATLTGLLAAFWVGYGLYFWAFGFGVLHIVYGFVMFWRYEKSDR
jgi:hypothetical protein